MSFGKFSMERKGFTLIELLIVVAIIAILAAIAIPNFLEAQVRAKVARVQGEFYNINLGLESYHVDWNWYPQDFMVYEYCGWDCGFPGCANDFEVQLGVLTTPVAYMTTLPTLDPFNDPGGGHPPGKYFYENIGDHWYWQNRCIAPYPIKEHHYPVCGHTASLQKCFLWMLKSYGPDGTYEWEPVLCYDSSNGTISIGEIVRVGP